MSETEEQIFLKLKSEQDLVEFLLDKQALAMIRAGFITRDEIRQTVETGFRNKNEMYSKTFFLEEHNLGMNVFVYLDEFLRVVNKVEKLYF